MEQTYDQPKTPEEWTTYYMRMASDLYDLTGRQGTRWIEMADAVAPHLPPEVRAELGQAVSEYCGQLRTRMAEIANGLVPGPRVPVGARLVWAVPGHGWDEGPDQYLCTGRELAASLVDVAGGPDPEPRLLWDVAPTRVPLMHKRHVTFVRSGTCSDHVHTLKDADPQDFPLCLVDPRVTFGPTAVLGQWYVTGEGPDLDTLNAAVDRQIADLSTRLDSDTGDWNLTPEQFHAAGVSQ
jgi:hypothetical protein